MLSAGIYLFGCAIYWIWASGELQPWAQKSPIDADSKQKSPEAATYVGYANEGLEMSE